MEMNLDQALLKLEIIQKDLEFFKKNLYKITNTPYSPAELSEHDAYICELFNAFETEITTQAQRKRLPKLPGNGVSTKWASLIRFLVARDTEFPDLVDWESLSNVYWISFRWLHPLDAFEEM